MQLLLGVVFNDAPIYRVPLRFARPEGFGVRRLGAALVRAQETGKRRQAAALQGAARISMGRDFLKPPPLRMVAYWGVVGGLEQQQLPRRALVQRARFRKELSAINSPAAWEADCGYWPVTVKLLSTSRSARNQSSSGEPPWRPRASQ